MKSFITLLLLNLLLIVLAIPAAGQDIREAARKAAADRASAQEEARLAEEAILADQARLRAEVGRLEQEQASLEQDLRDLESRQADARVLREKLVEEWAGRELGFREISGNVRVAARDLESMLKASPLSAGLEWRLDTVSPLLDTGYFPDIDDIAGMAGVFFDEIDRGGQVSLREGEFIGRDGRQAKGRILQLGKFTTVYQAAGETGFLVWSPEGKRLFALAELPPRNVRRSLNKYLSGESELVPLDMSGGAALRQLTQHTDLIEQVRQGGPIIWPIFLIALAALVIVVLKIIYLNRMHGNTDRIMGEVNELAAKGEWAACDQIVAGHQGKKWPVVRVIRAGLEARNDSRETLESVLQEAILVELPQVQKGIAMLAVLGAVAPLLGLLGTVTGMIDTFRVITLFGTSDPKLMSGGISEALVTTELGLAVAIPIMLVHTYLSRKSDHLIGDMEAKAVQLTNIIEKQQIAGNP